MHIDYVSTSMFSLNSSNENTYSLLFDLAQEYFVQDDIT